MAFLRELKFYSPLQIKIYSQEEDILQILEDYETGEYSEEIYAALLRERASLDEKTGLMKYFDGSEAVQKKVASLFFDIEEWDGRLLGVTLIQTRSPLTEQELAELLDYAEEQMSDGFGEGFEQREIQTPDGDLYVHFWNSKNFEFVPEDAFDASCFCPDYRRGFRHG